MYYRRQNLREIGSGVCANKQDERNYNKNKKITLALPSNYVSACLMSGCHGNMTSTFLATFMTSVLT